MRNSLKYVWISHTDGLILLSNATLGKKRLDDKPLLDPRSSEVKLLELASIQVI